MIVEFAWQLFSKGLNGDLAALKGFSIEIKSKEKGDLVSLQVFLSAVELAVVFE